MQQFEWDEKQYSQLTGQPHPDIQRYLDTRHLPAPKREYLPEPETASVEPYKSPAHALSALIVAFAPPAVAIVAVGGVVWVVVAACCAAVGAVFAFVSAYALPIGGGLTAVVCLVLWVWGAKSGGEDAKGGMPPPPNDGGKYEWYQEQNQRQGWRKV